jgi:hypothetical protein
MNDIFLKYNSLDPVSQKRVRDFIDRLVAKMKSDVNSPALSKRNFLLTSTWVEHDGMLLSRWSVK